MDESIDTPMVHQIPNDEWPDDAYVSGTMPTEIDDDISTVEFLEGS